jgi:AraC family transcriptional regulator
MTGQETQPATKGRVVRCSTRTGGGHVQPALGLRHTLPPVAQPARSAARKWHLSGDALNCLRAYIDASSQRRVTLAELARACGMSVAYLCRCFKSTTGRTVHAYVEEVRLARAKVLLRETALPLKQIAYELGFSSGSGFSIAFRRATGATPLSYRDRNGGSRRD